MRRFARVVGRRERVAEARRVDVAGVVSVAFGSGEERF